MKLTSRYAIILSTLISGLCYYFGNGLSGDFWYLVWLAPIPILCISVVNPAKVAFTASFIAYLIGRLSWFWYLARIITIPPAIILTIVPSLIFAGIIILSRAMNLKLKAWYAFPFLFTAFEYILIRFAPDGTAASIAYSQMNCLPLIQIASVTGILGITFIVTFIPATIAFRKKSGFIIVGVVFVFGFIRLYTTSSGDKIKVGMIVMKESLHNTSDKPDTIKDYVATAYCLRQIDSIAGHGISIILLPERTLSNEAIPSLVSAAIKNNVYILSGYTNFRGGKEYNSAIVINNKGEVITDYDKHHLIKGLEHQFIPGTQLGLFELNNLPVGIAICKDLDFQDYIRQYGKNKPAVLFVPAWDFIVDDWLHGRMAILRSVENGFSEVRAARLGTLTINDCYGRVSAEVSSTNSQGASLVAEVSTKRVNTFYTRLGDWPGIISVVIFLILTGLMFRQKSPDSPL